MFFKIPDFEEENAMGFGDLEFRLQEPRARRIQMNPQVVQRNTQRHLVDIPTAAFKAGYSPRDFRRIIEEDHIPVIQIGQKYFITGADLETWKSTYGEARIEQCLKQLDRWLKDKEEVRGGAQPAQDFGDDD